MSFNKETDVDAFVPVWAPSIKLALFALLELLLAQVEESQLINILVQLEFELLNN